jgi:predicted RNase H-like HicB family nuclease
MTEITFLVQEAEEGGYTARALGKSIFTEGETMLELKSNIKEAILCYFGDNDVPQLAHLHFVKDEILEIA